MAESSNLPAPQPPQDPVARKLVGEGHQALIDSLLRQKGPQGARQAQVRAFFRAFYRTRANMRLLEAGSGPKAPDLGPSVYRDWMEHGPKEFLRLKALCQAVGLKPPAGASEEEAGEWWLRLWQAPEDLHDDFWRMFPEYIVAQRRAIAETVERMREVFHEAVLPSLRSKKDTIARQAEDITRLDKEVQDLRRRIPKGRSMSTEAMALAILIDHCDWTNEQIAAAIRCHPKSLSRFKKFNDAKKLLREHGRRGLAHGSKYRRPDGDHADLEAWEEDSDK